MLHGIEIYRSRPIFYGLGNFIFHTTNSDRWQNRVGARPWQSVVALCDLSESGRISAVRLAPIAIGHSQDLVYERIEPFHDLPVTVLDAYVRKIVDLVADLSREFDTRVSRNGDTGRITV